MLWRGEPAGLWAVLLSSAIPGKAGDRVKSDHDTCTVRGAVVPGAALAGPEQLLRNVFLLVGCSDDTESKDGWSAALARSAVTCLTGRSDWMIPSSTGRSNVGVGGGLVYLVLLPSIMINFASTWKKLLECSHQVSSNSPASPRDGLART